MARYNTVGKVATKISRSGHLDGRPGTLRVTYHGTDVVTVDEDGIITLDHGGWMTPTTKVRMNQAANQFNLGFSVYQKAWQWYVATADSTREWSQSSRMTIN